MGVEVTAKTLGVIGCGNIGSIVADRAQGLRMKVIAYDPFLTPDRALDLGVEKVELDELFRRADFITLHTPMTEKTRNIINAKSMANMKKGVRIINCARGGLMVEAALAEAIKSGHVAGAALDVFEVEPAKENPLFGLREVVCTPHLGAATDEAQENVALQVAEQMADYLLQGAVSNAINMPVDLRRGSAEAEAVRQAGRTCSAPSRASSPRRRPHDPARICGRVAELNTRALNSAAVAGVLKPLPHDINMVSAPIIAKDRGIQVEEVRRGQEGAYETYMRVTLKTERGERAVAARYSLTASRASSRSTRCRWMRSSRLICSTPKMRTSPVISARLERCSATRA